MFIKVISWTYDRSLSKILVRSDTHITFLKIVQFSRSHTSSCPVASKAFLPPWPLRFDFKRIPVPLQMVPNLLIEHLIKGWLLYVIMSFLQDHLRFHYQFINLVWLSIVIFPFSWNQRHPRATFENMKTSFSHSSYNKKMCLWQDWADALMSAFLWLYTLMCPVV